MSKLSKQDYELIAKVVREASTDIVSKRVLAKDFAEALKGTNPAFDAERFIQTVEPKQ